MLQKNNTPNIRDLLRDEPLRTTEMVCASEHWRLDASRTPVELNDWRAYFDPAVIEKSRGAVTDLFSGSVVNPSENQPALHMALRALDPGEMVDPADVATIEDSRRRLLDLAGRLYRGETRVRTVLHAGIGGSDLGPRLVADALDPGDSAVRVEWLATLDSRRISRLLNQLNPDTTALVVASKSFSTSETLSQAALIRDWLGTDGSERIWAATANADRARAFGIANANILAFPGWTGGRYSLWSSVGLSAAARIGPSRWQALLAGAARADKGLTSKLEASPAYALARVLDSLVRGCGFNTLGVVSYDPALRLLSEYLQQLVMESLGKSVGLEDAPVSGHTSPLVFGGAGTDLQHSLFQALHQGTRRHPMLLLGSARCSEGPASWTRDQLSHLLGQASALVNGKQARDRFKALPGNNPVMLMLTPAINAQSVGELLASFEHAVYLLGTFWGINAFDQWGVEEGKRLAAAFRTALEGGGACPDSSLEQTTDWIRRSSSTN